MQKNGVWLPLLASIGIGAAAYYTMSRKNQTIGQTIQKVMPLVASMSHMGSNNN